LEVEEVAEHRLELEEAEEHLQASTRGSRRAHARASKWSVRREAEEEDAWRHTRRGDLERAHARQDLSVH
jgi:hypothetical protein